VKDNTIRKIVKKLIGIRKSPHSAHDTEHVVVNGIDAYLGVVGGAYSVVADSKVEGGVIDAREVACAAGLVVFGGKGEGIYVDTSGGYVGVVLVRLDEVEVAAFTFIEAVVSVKFDESGDNGVVASLSVGEGGAVATVEDGAVPPVGVVEALLSFPAINDGAVAADEGVALDDPYKFLNGVVEVKTDLVAAAADAFVASELKLFDEVFVGELGHATAFFGVEVDVIYPEGGGYKTSVGYAAAYGVVASAVPAEVLKFFEIEVKFDFVVLEGDERKSKTRVAAEPELERDVHGVLRSTAADFAAGVRFASGAVIIATFTSEGEEVGELRDVTYHLGVTSLFASGLGKFVPDVEPVAILLVDALATNFKFYILDKTVSYPVEPTEFSVAGIVVRAKFYLRESYLKVYSVDKITITADSAAYSATEVGYTIEGLFDGFHREVGVSAVYHLEEGYLRVRCQIDILRAVSYKLH